MEVDEIECVLISCLEKYLHGRKNNIDKCGKENQFFLKDIYEKLFKDNRPLYCNFISWFIINIKIEKIFF